MIYVCPLPHIEETVGRTGARRLVSLLSAGTPLLRPASLEPDHHLILSMNDIVAEQADMTPPGQEHVEMLLAFAKTWDRQQPMVINCFAGISRSTAAAYIVASALSPHRNEAELAQSLRAVSPSATPNIRLVTLADGILGRQGRMIEAIKAIGRGADAFEGVPFGLEL